MRAIPEALRPLCQALLGADGFMPRSRKQQILRDAFSCDEETLGSELLGLSGSEEGRNSSLERIAVIAVARSLAVLSVDVERLMTIEPFTPPSPFDAVAGLRELFGFVPALFQAQTSCPALLAAEVLSLQSLLGRNQSMTRAQKEEVLFAAAVARSNRACAVLHSEMLRNLGYDDDRLERLARSDLERLTGYPLGEPASQERAGLIGWAEFEAVLQRGLGTAPDLECEFVARVLNPNGLNARLSSEPIQPLVPDEDYELVQRVQAGDMAAFAQLINRHGQTVWRSVVALTGRPEDAEDHVQNAFIKAYEHVADFRGESRFSTWLTRIAINEALGHLRRDRKLESLEPDNESTPDSDGARPRPAQRWCEDPESNYSRTECQKLVERELGALPAAYRLPVVLRDLQGLSGEETAEILGLPLATMKTRLLRGRTMLREALTPYFALPKERPLA